METELADQSLNIKGSSMPNNSILTVHSSSDTDLPKKRDFFFGRSRHSAQEEPLRLSVSSQDLGVKENQAQKSSQKPLNVFAQPLFRTKSSTKRLSFKDFQNNSEAASSTLCYSQPVNEQSNNPSSNHFTNNFNNLTSFPDDFAGTTASTVDDKFPQSPLTSYITSTEAMEPSYKIPKSNFNSSVNEDLELYTALSENHESFPSQSLGLQSKENDPMLLFFNDQNAPETTTDQHNEKPSGEWPSTSLTRTPKSQAVGGIADLEKTDTQLPDSPERSNIFIPKEPPTMDSINELEREAEKKSERDFHAIREAGEDEELGIVMGVVKKWKTEAKQRDIEIIDMRELVKTLRNNLFSRDKTLNFYRERITFIEVMINRQKNSAERNSNRIGAIKTKYFSLRKNLLDMAKNIQGFNKEKIRIDNQVKKLKRDYSNLMAKQKYALEAKASLCDSQSTQLEHLRKLNGKLTESNDRHQETIDQLRSAIQKAEEKTSKYAFDLEAWRSKSDSMLNENSVQKSLLFEEIQQLKLTKQRSEDLLRIEVNSRKENEEKINTFAHQIQQLESTIEIMKQETARVRSMIGEKEERILALRTTELEYKNLQSELELLKDSTKKQLELKDQEKDTLSNKQAAELQRIEIESKEERIQFQEAFQKQRMSLEIETNNERAKLEGEYKEERTQRLKLESDYQEERSVRFHLESELGNSCRKVEEITRVNELYNDRIEQLEAQLSERDHRIVDSVSIAIGTLDIPERDLGVQHRDLIAEVDRINIGHEKKITELNSAVENFQIESNSTEAELLELKTKFIEISNEHRMLLEGRDNNDIQKKEAVDQALHRAAQYYQDLAKRAAVEHENEIRKRDCKLREAESRETALSEEIRSLHSQLDQKEPQRRVAQHIEKKPLASKPNTETNRTDLKILTSNDGVSDQKPIRQSRNNSTVPSLLDALDKQESIPFDKPFHSLSDVAKFNSLENTYNQHLTLLEIDAMALPPKNETDAELKVDTDSFLTDNSFLVNGLEKNKEKLPNLSNSVVPSLKDSKGEPLNEWLSPSTQLRTKRRKITRIDIKGDIQPSDPLPNIISTNSNLVTSSSEFERSQTKPIIRPNYRRKPNPSRRTYAG
ncbi:hypothetical protein G9A89_011566 [Geosiphon pyriformis]|nr:hypothetical protein G9A89_011566 [Geosiphon pyriformis]